MSASKTILPWRRFWCPLGSKINGEGDETGFLADPEDDYGSYFNPSLRSLAEMLPEVGALTLCGEPGIGKTTELDRVRAIVEADHASNGGAVCWLNFQEIAGFADFRRCTVESDTWKQWKQGQSRFTLVVDGVDEGQLRVAGFVNLLRGLLKNEPIERLRVLLACRTKEWPVAGGRELLGLWPGEAEARVYELCPLRRADVIVAAESRGHKPSAFMRAVSDRHVVPLATRPITLFFLLDEFAQHSALPQSQRELYRRATERLSGEVDEQRLEMLRSFRRASPIVTDFDRLRAAQRLACLLLVSGGTGIRATTAHGAPAIDSDLPADIASDSGATGVSSRALEEALESALFTSLGPHRFGFIHRTVAEYLASEHLRTLPLVQLRRLLCQRDGDGEHIVPQLAELGAWVAASNESFGEHVLKIEPEVLLRSDVIQQGDEFKSRLVESILNAAREERIFDGKGFDRFLSGLAHPRIEAQLRPIISNPQGHFVERRIAMSIAGKCRCAGLTDCLLARVRDASDDNHLRERAADALSEAVPDDQMALLEPLARGEIKPDPDDTIKAEALLRLVPRFWKVRDTLPHLIHPSNSHFFGSYWTFLNAALLDGLEDEDLLPVLAWLRSRRNCFDSQFTFHRLASVTFAKALQRLHEPAVAAVVVSLWQAWSQDDLHHLPRESEVISVLENDEGLRRNLVTLYLNDPTTDAKRSFALFSPVRLLTYEAKSLDWLLDKLVDVPLDRRAAWAAVIGHLANDPQYVVTCWDKLLQRIGEIPELAKQMAWLTRIWGLDKPDARKAKADHLREQRRAARMAKFSSQNRDGETAAAIHEAFAQFERGDDQAWPQLWVQLVSSDNGYLTHYSTSDLTTCPQWATLTAAQQATVPEIARAYLLSSARQAQPLDERDAAFWAARCALCLLRERFSDDRPLRETVLDSWLDAVVSNISSQPDAQRDLFRRVYELGAERTLDLLGKKARSEALKSQHPHVFQIAEDAWDAPLSNLALSVIRDSTSSGYVLNALGELAKRDPDVAVGYCEEVLVRQLSPNNSYPISLFGALIVGLLNDADRLWTAAETYLRADEQLARSVLHWVADGADPDRYNTRLQPSVETLGKLFELIRYWFPPAIDPPKRRDLLRDPVQRLRNRLPSTIAARADAAACRELLRLAAIVPADEATWIRHAYRDALTGFRRDLWRAPRAEDIKQILGRAQTRLLANDDDLLELVLESLERLEDRLKRQSLPQAEDLWSWDGGGNRRRNFAHKDEEAISDYVARWLRDDLGPAAGIVVGREVQPRRGSHTDITVQATVRNESAETNGLIVVIEIKGCWHPDVLTALRSQLAEGYLKEQGARCGVYLVGWFKCPQWQNDDTKLASTTVADAKKEVADLASSFDGIASSYKIGAYLLDCTLPPAQSPSSRTRA